MRGDYSTEESYLKNDVVLYQDGSYISLMDNKNKLPTNTTYWKKLIPNSTQIYKLIPYLDNGVLKW